MKKSNERIHPQNEAHPQLIEALSNNDVELLNKIIGAKRIVIDDITLKKYSIGPEIWYRYDAHSGYETQTVLEYASSHCSTPIILALLKADCYISDDLHTNPFYRVITDNKEASVPEIWCHSRIINKPFYDSIYGTVSPIVFAYLHPHKKIFNTLLACRTLDIHQPFRESEPQNACALAKMLCYTGQEHTELRDILIRYYVDFILDNPQDTRKIFQAHPIIPSLLSKYKESLWHAVQNQVYHRYQQCPEHFLALLEEIYLSKNQDKSLQHPLYIVFSTVHVREAATMASDHIANSVVRFFSGDQLNTPIFGEIDVLKEIEKKINMVRALPPLKNEGSDACRLS